jgi:serine/threonine protein kinase
MAVRDKKIRVNLGKSNTNLDEHLRVEAALNEHRILKNLGYETHIFFIHHQKPKTRTSTPCHHTVYIIQPYLGQTLTTYLINKKNTLSLHQKINLALQLINKIQEIHEKNIAHSDIKSDNIVVDEKGHLHLIDFGLSQDISNKNQVDNARLFDTSQVFQQIYCNENENPGILSSTDLDRFPELKNTLSEKDMESINLSKLQQELQKAKNRLNSPAELKIGVMAALTGSALLATLFTGILPAVITCITTVMLAMKIMAAIITLAGAYKLSKGALHYAPCCRA